MIWAIRLKRTLVRYNTFEFPHNFVVFVTHDKIQHLVVGNDFFSRVTVYTFAYKFYACWVIRNVLLVILYETDNFESLFLTICFCVLEERTSDEIVWAEYRCVGLLVIRLPILIEPGFNNFRNFIIGNGVILPFDQTSAKIDILSTEWTYLRSI